MKKVKYVIFRYLTNADYFNIYKPSGTESSGGGQTYIDFATGYISDENWSSFFQSVEDIQVTQTTTNPRWNFPIHSLGSNEPQRVDIYKRRPQSFSIAAQRIGSASSNRINSWKPENGFPQPKDPNNRQSKPDGLAIYLVRCEDGTVWAGWFQEELPFIRLKVFENMDLMENLSNREGYSGFINLSESNIWLDETNSYHPFTFGSNENETNQEDDIIAFDESNLTNSLLIQDVDLSENIERRTRKKAQEVIIRNQKAVNSLKKLYNGRCQITGDQYSFRKSNGELYSEAHHLIPLGSEGSDSPYNIIIVNPLIHRMLHYAEVEGLDIARISSNNTLDFLINGKPYTITWHPSHAELIRQHQN